MLDLKRLSSSLRQIARTTGRETNAEQIALTTASIIDVCGDASKNRKMAFRIGKILLTQSPVRIIVPVCPDYSHKEGKYTFETLGNGIPLLATLHIQFLQRIRSFVPNMDVLFLLADQEAEDEYLCRAVRMEQKEFVRCIRESAHQLNEHVSHWNWSAKTMTDEIENLLDAEKREAGCIKNNPLFEQRIIGETHARSEMYERISRTMSFDTMCERTVRTAAQYVSVGKFAAQNDYIICNHSTVNLSWYLQTDAAVLHNNISVY